MKTKDILDGGFSKKLEQKRIDNQIFDLVRHCVMDVRRSRDIHELIKLGVEELDYHECVYASMKFYKNTGHLFPILVFKFKDEHFVIGTKYIYDKLPERNIRDYVSYISRKEQPAYTSGDTFEYDKLAYNIVRSFDYLIYRLRRDIERHIRTEQK